MALADAIEGARHTAQQITWTDQDSNAIDLTGASLTGVKIARSSGTATALDGTLAITDASNGIFTWTYGATDVATPGDYLVQFTATYGAEDLERSLVAEWTVFEALAVA